MDFIEFNYLWIVVAIATFLTLIIFKVRAPYGRHSSDKWGMVIPNKWGWFIMELPAFLLMPILALLGPSPKNEVTYLLIGLWSLHYAYRTLVFPFRIKTQHKKIPLLIVVSAVFFNGVNGFLNGYYLGYMDGALNDIGSTHVVVGLLLFATGMYINRSSDKRLISLRRDREGYQIPRGGLFKYISCPNHFGEIVEWCGFMLIAWNLPAITFAVWTFCNLSPRSLNHHKWYQEKFSDYPKKRKALFPFVF
jgi:protein-S-isoprenylcysteine O-methyltransferase Ste14